MKTEKNRTVLAPGEMKEFVCAVVQVMPADVDPEVARYFMGHKGELAGSMQEVFGSVMLAKDLLRYWWPAFYKKFFGREVDFSGVAVPEYQPGFSWLIPMAQGIGPNAAFDACQRYFSCWRYYEDLDRQTYGKNDREPLENYVVWARRRREADEELKNKSAEELKEEAIKGNTLAERIIMELAFWDRTGQHLDVDNVTLCAGSRYHGGYVPSCVWRGGEFDVFCYDPRNADPNLRARAVVSL